MFTLIIEDKHGSVADEYTFEEGEFLIGRSQSADIILPSDNVSRRHARLYTVDGRCYIEDLQSANGVFVNGRRIHEVFQIQRAAQIKVGDYYLHIEGGDAGPDAERVYCRLLGQNLAFAEQVFNVTKTVTLVGRGKDCSLTFIDPSISRIHGKITVDRGGTLLVEDLKSSNGTFINNERIEVGTVNHGDVLRFGNAEFIVEVPDAASAGGGEAGYEAWPEAQPSGKRGLWVVLAIVGIVVAIGAIVFAVAGDSIFGGDGETPKTDTEISDKNDKNDDDGDKDDGAADDAAQKKADEIAYLISEGNKAVKKRDWKKALKAWKQVKDLDPLHPKAQKAINQITTWQAHQKLLDKAISLEKDKKWGEAARALKDILADEASVYHGDAKQRIEGLQKMKSTLMLSADAKADSKKCEELEEALSTYKDIRVIDPRDASVAEKVKKVEAAKSKAGCK